MKPIAFEKTDQQALIEALHGHRLDSRSQDSGQHCVCGSDGRAEQAGGDLPWGSLDEHRAQVILASGWLHARDTARLAAVETERDRFKGDADVAVARMFSTEQREADLRTAIEAEVAEWKRLAGVESSTAQRTLSEAADDIRALVSRTPNDPTVVGTHRRAMAIAQEWVRISQWREDQGLHDGITGLYRQCAAELRAAIGDPPATHAAMLDHTKSEVLRETAEALPTLRGLIRMAALVVMQEVGEEDKALATAIASKASANVARWLADRTDEHSFNTSGVATTAADAPAQAKTEASWITGPEQAAQFVAAVAWPWEREQNRDGWALKMLTDKDLFALECARSHGRLNAAIATVRNAQPLTNEQADQ